MITCEDVPDCIDYEYCNFCPAKAWMWNPYKDVRGDKEIEVEIEVKTCKGELNDI